MISCPVLPCAAATSESLESKFGVVFELARPPAVHRNTMERTGETQATMWGQAQVAESAA